jgi:hypothetical protein
MRSAILLFTTISLLFVQPLSARAADVLTPGLLKMSIYTNIAGTAVTDLTADPNFPAAPGEVRYLRSFNTRDAAPNDVLENFGGRIEGFISPLETGDYTFFLRSDAGSQLWLSTDATEANATMIAEELDRGDAFREPDTGDLATSAAITLTAGQRHFIMVLYKSGALAGNSTDFAQVAWRKSDDTTPAASLQPIHGAFLSTLASDAGAPSVTITEQPQNITAAENSRATFTVAANFSPTNYTSILWQRNGVNIPNATGPTYTRFLDMADNGAKFRAVLSVPGATVNSAEATATVTADTAAPTLLSARGGPNRPEVTLTFSERVNATAATTLANYRITSPTGVVLPITAATQSVDRTQVTLTTEPQAIGTNYTVSVNNITDLAAAAPNTIAPNSTAGFLALGPWLQGEDGFVVFEAEHYDRNLDGLWSLNTDRGVPSGGASMVVYNGAGGNEDNTKLEYDINFTTTGTNIVWWRFSGNDGNDDSAIVHIDGARPVGREAGNRAALSGTGANLLGNWGWTANASEGGGQMTFVIDTPGVHTFAIVRREDGSYADKFVITKDPTFNPTSAFGPFGPAETLRQGEPAGPGEDFQFTSHPVSSTQAVENTSITLSSGVALPAGRLFSFQWQRRDGANFVDIPGATGTNFTLNPLTLNWNGAVVRMRAIVAGTTKFSSEATITVTPETIAPRLLNVTGTADPASVIVLFDEPVTAASAQNLANYSLTSAGPPLPISTATLLPNNRMVILETAAQTAGTKYTLNVNGVADTAATPNLTANLTGSFYSQGARLPQGDDGLIVFEAEDFDRNTDDRWVVNTTRGTPSGGASVVLPNGAGGNEDSRLEYDLTFTKTGTHIIWYRARGDSGSDDSSWLFLDGARPPGRTAGNFAAMTGFETGVSGDFIWQSDPFEGPNPMTFDITTAGLHTIGLVRREDGSYFDKFVITTDPAFNPNDFGPFGPPQTRQGVPPLPTLSITSPQPDTEFTTGTPIPVTVQLGTTTRSITKVEFFHDSQQIAESTAAPYSFTWQNAPAGTNTITAVLSDDAFGTVRSAPVTFIVGSGQTTDFTVSIARSATGLTLSWSGGNPPYTVQKKADLNDATWTNVLTTNETTAPVPLEGARGFFRIATP